MIGRLRGRVTTDDVGGNFGGHLLAELLQGHPLAAERREDDVGDLLLQLAEGLL